MQDVHVAIIGAGFAGIGMAIRLREAGFEDYVILERAGDLGGTWRDNHYPGCCCDVPSHVYSYSFELNRGWTRGFAPQPEILAYLRRTAEKYGVAGDIRFGQEVTEASWEEGDRRWRLRTAAGDEWRAQVVVAAAGALSDPSTPDVPGLDRFAGKMFHSARWDHDHDLSGERVAVIGTGASAIQFVPQIQPRVERLHVFQRTPPWVIPRLDHRITKAEHRLLRWIPFAPSAVRAVLFWLLEVRVVGFRHPRIMRAADRVARWHLRRQVADRDLRRKLTPDYTMGCKRILISDDYYPALAQPGVEVVTDGIEEVRERSVVTKDGAEREVDTIIFGTGFQVSDVPIASRVRGRDGRTLAEHWRERGGMAAYKGTVIAGFPNFFVMTGPNTGLGHNSMIFMIESQIAYVVDAVRTMRERGLTAVDVRPDAQERYNKRLQEDMDGTVWTAGSCHSWYLDDTGRNTTLWPGWTMRFRRSTREFDAAAFMTDNGARPAPVTSRTRSRARDRGAAPTAR